MSAKSCYTCELYNRQEKLLKCAWDPITARDNPLEGCRDWEIAKPEPAAEPEPVAPISMFHLIIGLIMPSLFLINMAFRVFYPESHVIKRPHTERYEDW